MKTFSSAQEMQDHYRDVKSRMGMLNNRRPISRLVPRTAVFLKSQEMIEKDKRDCAELTKLFTEFFDELEKKRLKVEAQNPSLIHKIIKITARLHRVTVKEIIGPSRKANLVVPRQIAMHISRMYLADDDNMVGSFPNIGRYFSNRDHTTVLHAHRKIERLKVRDEDLRRTVGVICAELNKMLNANG